MSEDQAVSAPAVDVAAIRAALSWATPGDWWRDGMGVEAAHGLVANTGDRDGFDAELIVLLRNNAEALLDALAEAGAKVARVEALVLSAKPQTVGSTLFVNRLRVALADQGEQVSP